jgi:hypothetical protein
MRPTRTPAHLLFLHHRITSEQLRAVLGLDSVKDAGGEVIKEAPLAVWANLRQRALDTAIKEINAKTDLTLRSNRSSEPRIGE